MAVGALDGVIRGTETEAAAFAASGGCGGGRLMNDDRGVRNGIAEKSGADRHGPAGWHRSVGIEREVAEQVHQFARSQCDFRGVARREFSEENADARSEQTPQLGRGVIDHVGEIRTLRSWGFAVGIHDARWEAHG